MCCPVRTCEYMEEWLDDMYICIAVSEALQPEGESVQQRWLMAQNMEESVTALVNMDVRAVTPDGVMRCGSWASA